MNEEICLDANILLACVVPEIHTDMCLKLMLKLRERQSVIYEPALVLFEVASVLRRKVQLGELSKLHAEQALGIITELPMLLQWQSSILEESLRLSHALKFKNSYDASYLAVAKLRGIACVTLDKEFLKKAGKLYRKLYSVERFMSLI